MPTLTWIIFSIPWQSHTYYNTGRYELWLSSKIYLLLNAGCKELGLSVWIWEWRAASLIFLPFWNMCNGLENRACMNLSRKIIDLNMGNYQLYAQILKTMVWCILVLCSLQDKSTFHSTTSTRLTGNNHQPLLTTSGSLAFSPPQVSLTYKFWTFHKRKMWNHWSFSKSRPCETSKEWLRNLLKK